VLSHWAIVAISYGSYSILTFLRGCTRLDDLGAEIYELVKTCTEGREKVFEHVQKLSPYTCYGGVRRCT